MSLALPSPVPAKDGSEMERASMGLENTKWPRIVSMESADRMPRRDAQMGRGEWRPAQEGGASPESLSGSNGGVTDSGEGVSPNNWVNFLDFLTSSARSCGCR
jgi:hypothetical protein